MVHLPFSLVGEGGIGGLWPPSERRCFASATAPEGVLSTNPNVKSSLAERTPHPSRRRFAPSIHPLPQGERAESDALIESVWRSHVQIHPDRFRLGEIVDRSRAVFAAEARLGQVPGPGICGRNAHKTLLAASTKGRVPAPSANRPSRARRKPTETPAPSVQPLEMPFWLRPVRRDDRAPRAELKPLRPPRDPFPEDPPYRPPAYVPQSHGKQRPGAILALAVEQLEGRPIAVSGGEQWFGPFVEFGFEFSHW